MNKHTLSQDVALLFLRLVLGGSMLFAHGWRKLLKLTSAEPIDFADPFGIGAELSLYLVIFAEVVCSLLLVIGLFTRLATVPLIITMLVVILAVQWDAPFSKSELPLLFLAGYCMLAAFGGGRYALDARRHRI